MATKLSGIVSIREGAGGGRKRGTVEREPLPSLSQVPSFSQFVILVILICVRDPNFSKTAPSVACEYSRLSTPVTVGLMSGACISTVYS